jgi:hypothetical protein
MTSAGAYPQRRRFAFCGEEPRYFASGWSPSESTRGMVLRQM